MKAFDMLPEGYNPIFSVDLQKDKKMALLINALAGIIAVLLIVPMVFTVPLNGAFSDGKFIAVALLIVVYTVLHELVHGIAMKLCGTKKVKYGFTGLYAYAGSDDYYDKKGYIFIALAPVVLWGVVIAVVNFIVPTEWFWVVYLLQVINLSGASGDFYVTFKFSRMPKDILIKDHGTGMNVFSKENI